MKFLAQTSSNPFGKIAPPPGSPGGTDAAGGIGDLIGKGIAIFILVAAIATLIYALLGAFDWITSNGEKEKVNKARMRITHAFIGFLLIFVALAVFATVAGNITHIITVGPNGWSFNLPTIGGCLSPGTSTGDASSCCSKSASYQGSGLACN